MMKRKRLGKLGSTGKGKRRRPLLSRKTRIRKGPGRKSRKGLPGKPGKKSLQLRKKKATPPVTQGARCAGHTGNRNTIGAAGDSAPPELGVPPELPPGDAYQQGYTEAYNVGFDAGFAKGFEDGHKLELG